MAAFSTELYSPCAATTITKPKYDSLVGKKFRHGLHSEQIQTPIYLFRFREFL